MVAGDTHYPLMMNAMFASNGIEIINYRTDSCHIEFATASIVCLSHVLETVRNQLLQIIILQSCSGGACITILSGNS